MRTRNNISQKQIALLCASIFLVAGCSKEKKGEGAKATASKAANSSSPATNTVAAVSRTTKSVFTIDQNSRDPFFPKARKVAAGQTEAAAPQYSLDIPTLLRSAFQGIGLSGD